MGAGGIRGRKTSNHQKIGRSVKKVAFSEGLFLRLRGASAFPFLFLVDHFIHRSVQPVQDLIHRPRALLHGAYGLVIGGFEPGPVGDTVNKGCEDQLGYDNEICFHDRSLLYLIRKDPLLVYAKEMPFRRIPAAKASTERNHARADARRSVKTGKNVTGAQVFP
jgi:hypothetical protein